MPTFSCTFKRSLDISTRTHSTVRCFVNHFVLSLGSELGFFGGSKKITIHLTVKSVLAPMVSCTLTVSIQEYVDVECLRMKIQYIYRLLDNVQITAQIL